MRYTCEVPAILVTSVQCTGINKLKIRRTIDVLLGTYTYVFTEFLKDNFFVNVLYHNYIMYTASRLKIIVHSYTNIDNKILTFSD